MTTGLKSAILTPALFERRYGGIAQLARARGSYPRCHWFKSSCRYQQNTDFIRFHIDKRPGGQAVKTPPFHGGNTGSSPVRVTTFSQPFIWRHSSAGRASASHAEGHRFEFCCLHQKERKKALKRLSFGAFLHFIYKFFGAAFRAQKVSTKMSTTSTPPAPPERH